MTEKKTKYIVVAGSIMSGLGKGIVTSSIGKILQSKGYKVVPIKFDGYLNVDCGTMNPFRHGEVFVLDDGTEVDMDFGTYERFLNFSISGSSSITGGKLFQKIIEKERNGDFLGRDVQFVPHLTDEIKNRVRAVGKENNADIVMIEVGGTVGDLESGYFLEAMRQFKHEEKEDVLIIQLTYVPSLSPGELKTKPTQHATRLLQSMGIQPDMILCREQEPLNDDAKKKIALYCNVTENAVFDDPTVRTIYELPLTLEKQGIYEVIAEKLNLSKEKTDLTEWRKLVERIVNPKGKTLNVAIVGKYTAVKDAYVSVKEALVHAAAATNNSVEVHWVESHELEKLDDVSKELSKYNAILVPGGFGSRGIEGKILAIEYARKNKIPYLGLCLGLQLMVVEYARNVLGLKDANSTEFNKDTCNPAIMMLPEKKQIVKMGGTLRLGAYDCKLKKGTIAFDAYGKDKISERHRHRYEVNPDYVEQLEKAGLVVSGTHDSGVVELVEWKDSFGVATQAHVELKSRLETPAPLFVEFIKAAAKEKK
ncbi:MAG: CTP synthase [Candidatus Micrarchaeota archaeon]|nr:CTP synthase [Candidatus Micrarchaeota archaeon]